MKALYGGSFDPLTNGHLWMIREAARLFEHVTVAVAVNPDKKYTFTLDQRLAMLNDVIQPLKNVSVEQIHNQYLVRYAKSKGIGAVVRGVRNPEDYAFEHTMRNVNQDISPDTSSVFLMPPQELEPVSSSMVKGLIGPDDWEWLVGKYVPSSVHVQLLNKFNGFKKRWLELHAQNGLSNAEEHYADLHRQYSEKHRAYHTLLHIGKMLKGFDEIEEDVADPLAME
ncbi:MAG: pantetheine-phosphate adenylyltransferase, partial [Nanoarchaeota archaeon]